MVLLQYCKAAINKCIYNDPNTEKNPNIGDLSLNLKQHKAQGVYESMIPQHTAHC